jgi:superfamily II DNA or RNA helicase
MEPKPSHQVVIPDLPSARTPEQAAIQRAAMEWSILAPIIIRTPEDVQSRVRWAADLSPFVHQYENLYTFCRRLPVSLIADDVGLGKTVSAGLILSELLTRQRVRRAIVLCPRILCAQWEAELRNKFGIDAYASTGTQDFLRAVEADHTVVITTNHSALNVLPQLAPGEFEMLILDEAHKLRNLYGTRSPPRIAERVRRALEKRTFNYVLMLTATPLHNRLWDMYSLVDLLALGRNHANPFGSPEEFRNNFIDDSYPGDRKLRRDRVQEFRGVVRDYMVRTRRLDAKLPFPTRKVQTVELPLPGSEATLFDYVSSVISQLEPLEQVSLAKALLSSPQALAQQLENMSVSRPRFDGPARKIRTFVDSMTDTAKLRALGRIVDELRTRGGDDWRLLIFTERTETQKAIGNWLQRRGVAVGYIRGGAAVANNRAVQGFQADPPNINCIVSTDAGSEGVNLQACSYLVNFDLPWNPMIVEQRIGRIQRLASKYESVVVQNLVLQHPADAHVVGLLMQKLAAISSAVDDIESVLEDVAASGNGGSRPFEDTVRELVIAALQKQDVSEALEIIEHNIEMAETKKKEQEEELDRIFAPENGSSHRDLRPPDLAYPEPCMAARDFVLRAKELEGSLEQGEEDTWLHRPADGLPEQFSFSKDVAAAGAGVFGRRIEHYDAGTPAFQRLVGKWSNDHHCLSDHSLSSPEQQLAFAQGLLADRPHLEVKAVTVLARRPQLQASFLVRAQVSNGVDRYEKLIEVGEKPAVTQSAMTTDQSPLRRRDLPPVVNEEVWQAVQRDSDVCKFLDYYTRKHEEERARAGDDSVRLARLSANYTPRIESKIVAATGARHAELDLDIAFAVNGHGEYRARFSADTLRRQRIREPIYVTCACTGYEVPVEATLQCTVTGTRGCAHAMVRSAVSAAAMLPSEAVVCEVSGTPLLPTEAATSDISGVRCDARLLRTSAISGRKGLELEAVMCGFTHTLVLVDEAIPSDLSGKPIRRDATTVLPDGRTAHESELQRCEESGALLPPDSLAQSDLSGRLVATSLLLSSALPPHRRGTESEFVTCAVSGKRVLNDEVVRSAVSDQPCLAELAVTSEQSGRQGLPSEKVQCCLSGLTLLCDEVVVSAVSGRPCQADRAIRSELSGRVALPSEGVTCTFTSTTVLSDEAAQSDISGASFRSDQASVLSDGRTCHMSEARQCEITAKNLALADGGESAVSGKWVHRSLLLSSEKPPHRLAVEEETVLCPISGKRLLRDEVATSASGLTADRDLLTRSEISGVAAFPDELQQCSHSGILALPSELELSSASGLPVDPRHLIASAVSGAKALAAEMSKCEVTGVDILPSEREESGVSGRCVRRDQLVRLEDGRLAHESETGTCSRTGKVIALADGETSAVSGVWVDAKLLTESEKTGRRALPEETRICALTQKRLLVDELGASTTGVVGDKDFLTASELSGAAAFPQELITCAESGRQGLPGEMGKSDVSGKTVAADLLRQSAVSSRVGLEHEFVTCDFTGKRVLRDEVAVSGVSGKTYPRADGTRDDEGHEGHQSEFARCSRSRRLIPKSRLRQSDVSGLYVDNELLVQSQRNPTRVGLSEETVRCSVTGKLLLRDEAAVSESSGATGDKDLLLESPRLRKKVFPDELVTCPHSKIRLLPEEMASSAVSGSRAAPEAFVPSAISGRAGLPVETGLCRFTHVRCLSDELRESDVSGLVYRVDQEGTHEDGRRGHVSEFRTCSHSSRCLLPTQGNPSAVSGKWVADDHAVFSELPPHRRGLPAELVRCEVTGKMLLVDELEVSAISGRRGNRTKLVQSAGNHKWGFPDEMVWLPDQQKWFTPDEVGKCGISGRICPLPELEKSQVSGRLAAKEHLVRCAASGQFVLTDEVKQCSVTKEWLLPQFLGWCVQTNAWVIRKLLIPCDLPEGLVIDDAKHRVRSRKLRICARRSAKRCYWSGEALFPDDGAECSLLGLWFDSTLIRDGALAVIAANLAPTHGEATAVTDPSEVAWIKSSFADAFQVGNRVRKLATPDGLRALYFVELSRWPWQPLRQLVFFGRFDQKRVFGRPVTFINRANEWQTEPSTTPE